MVIIYLEYCLFQTQLLIIFSKFDNWAFKSIRNNNKRQRDREHLKAVKFVPNTKNLLDCALFAYKPKRQ